jgi:hypothetical protein
MSKKRFKKHCITPNNYIKTNRCYPLWITPVIYHAIFVMHTIFVIYIIVISHKKYFNTDSQLSIHNILSALYQLQYPLVLLIGLRHH